MSAPGVLPPRQLGVLAAVCGSFGVMAWALWVWVFAGEPAQDWMVFYTAARAYFDGNLPLIFDGEALTAALNQRFAGWLALPIHLHPWVYPPSFLVLFAPFGMLPPFASLIVFMVSGFATLLAVTLLYVGRGLPRAVVLFSLVLCPAVPFNVMTGQNAFFTSALLVAGFGLLARYPLLAGAVLGILTFKPQMWLMVPVALLAARQWRAIGGAAASAFGVALLSFALFGPQIWRVWFGLMTGTDEAYRAWVTSGRLNGVSVFACVSWLGASPLLANLAQWAAIAIAAGFVYRAYRQPHPGALALAILLAATMLAAPHVSTSDAVLLALATSLFVIGLAKEGPRPAELMLAAAVWIIPLFNPPSVFRPGSFTPLLVVMLLGAITARIGEAGAPPVPGLVGDA